MQDRTIKIKTGLKPYVADAGAAAFAATALFALVFVVLEFCSPGIAASVVAPQGIAVLLLATAALSLAADAPRKRSWLALAGYALVALALTAFAFWAAWYYFSSVPELRLRLTMAIGTIVALTLAAAAVPLPDDT